MSSTTAISLATGQAPIEPIRTYLDSVTDDLLTLLPPIEQLSPAERRGIIARYTAVLEGNFIYWMTGAYIAAQSEEARSIMMENLLEEVRDSHPLMLRKFAVAANALPTDIDAIAVNTELSEVRLFIGRQSTVPIVAMMAFFESFIQRFMPYLEQLAIEQRSSEVEYTQVHGVCDIGHSEGLFRGLEAEMAIASDSREPDEYLYEGVHLLRDLFENVFTGRSAAAL